MGLPMAAARLNSALSPKVALPVPNGERMSGESYKATRAPAAMSSVRFPLREGEGVYSLTIASWVSFGEDIDVGTKDVPKDGS